MNTSKKRKRGFSVIELIVALSCIVILSAIVAPSISMYMMNSKVRTIKADLNAISAAVRAAHADLGVFPEDVAVGLDPGLRSNQAVPVSLCSEWKGPYMKSWPATCPWNGTYNYECGSCEAFDYDFVAGNEVYLEVKGAFPETVLDSIDAEIDDGIRFSGNLRHDGATRFSYFLGEGNCWKPSSLR